MLTYADAAEVTNMRPMSLRGSRFAAADVLEREGAMVPATGTRTLLALLVQKYNYRSS
jgi:hypothetical protein